MEYLKITNWDKWQSYRKDRGQPPWIKVHRRLLRNLEWVDMSDSERGQLVSLWLLAADHDGVIPASPSKIQKLCFLTKQPNIKKFIELGFLEYDGFHDINDVTMASPRRQDDQPKAKAEAETKAETETDTASKTPYGEFKNVKLTGKEYGKLIELFGEDGTKERIENLSAYVASKGKKYSSHYATILSWDRKNNGFKQRKKKNEKYPDDPMPDNVFLHFEEYEAWLERHPEYTEE